MDEGAGGHGAGRDGSHCKGARSSGLLEEQERRERVDDALDGGDCRQVS